VDDDVAWRVLSVKPYKRAASAWTQARGLGDGAGTTSPAPLLLSAELSMVGLRRLIVSQPELKARLVSVISD